MLTPTTGVPVLRQRLAGLALVVLLGLGGCSDEGTGEGSARPEAMPAGAAGSGSSTIEAAPGTVVAGAGDLALGPGFSGCPGLLPPTVSRTMTVAARFRPQALCYEAFAVLHSGVTRTPLVVAQRLTPALLVDAGDEVRTDAFYPEPRLAIGDRAELADYRGSGYDRGHLAPAADMPTPVAMLESFSLANIVPQLAANNRGPWAKIEADTRKYVRRASGDVYVLTGVHFDASATRIGDGVMVPSALWKLVHVPAEQRTWVHWLDNTETARVGPPLDYDSFVARTGLDLLGR